MSGTAALQKDRNFIAVIGDEVSSEWLDPISLILSLIFLVHVLTNNSFPIGFCYRSFISRYWQRKPTTKEKLFSR